MSQKVNADQQKAVNEKSTSDAPASLSSDPKKKVPRDKPAVSPPFAKVSMNKFLMNLTLVLLAILAFYGWRVTVWAADAGGYWSLITGNPNKAAALANKQAAMESASASVSAGLGGAAYTPLPKASGGTGTGNPASIQAAVLHLASLLGCSPADLTTLIRPLVDPTVPNPVEEARRIIAQVGEGGVGGAGQVGLTEKEEKEVEEKTGAGLLGILEEMVLD